MRRPSVTTKNSTLRKCNIVVESICLRKKDLPHYHDYVQLWYVLSGMLRHTVNGKEYLQTPGTCVIVLPFTDHAIDTLDSEDTPVTLSLSFTDDFLTEHGCNFFSYTNRWAKFEKGTIPEFTALSGIEKEKADKLARNMLSEFAHTKIPDFNKIFIHLRDFLEILCLDTAEDNDLSLTIERTKAILRAVAYMADNIDKQIPREDLCTITAMSKTNLSRIFKATTGTTMKQFLIALRLRRAQYLLQFTDKSLNEIAAEVGLYDKSRLTHLFREHFDISPIQFRQNTRPYALESDKLTRRRLNFYPKILSSDNDAKD